MTMAAPTLRMRWQNADPLLLIATLGLTALGVLLVTSATWKYPEQPSLTNNPWFMKQFAFAVMGVFIMAFCASIQPAVMRVLAYPAYAGCLIALGVVLVVGHGANEFEQEAHMRT